MKETFGMIFFCILDDFKEIYYMGPLLEIGLGNFRFHVNYACLSSLMGLSVVSN